MERNRTESKITKFEIWKFFVILEIWFFRNFWKFFTWPPPGGGEGVDFFPVNENIVLALFPVQIWAPNFVWELS